GPFNSFGEQLRAVALAGSDAGQWQLSGDDTTRAAMLAAVAAAGGTVLRLERQNLALEDWFVQRVQQSHAAGREAPC
ncbi:MAG: hypothetical protein ACOCXJ_07885, partial [Planctomycetota bacterium]